MIGLGIPRARPGVASKRRHRLMAAGSPIGAGAALSAALLAAPIPAPIPVPARSPPQRVPDAATGAVSASHQVVTGDGVVLRVRTAHGSEQERRTIEQLRRILSRHALAPWIGTRELRVDSDAIPHSHPVLTLDTSYLEDDARQLASFVHEQFHWYLDATPARRRAVDRAIADLSRLFPDAPTHGPEGARGRQSTLLHLIVCGMELDAMSRLIGPERARRQLAGKHFYTWIYRQVLQNPDVSRVRERYALVVPDNPRAASAGGMTGGPAGARGPGR